MRKGRGLLEGGGGGEGGGLGSHEQVMLQDQAMPTNSRTAKNTQPADYELCCSMYYAVLMSADNVPGGQVPGSQSLPLVPI